MKLAGSVGSAACGCSVYKQCIPVLCNAHVGDVATKCGFNGTPPGAALDDALHWTCSRSPGMPFGSMLDTTTSMPYRYHTRHTTTLQPTFHQRRRRESRSHSRKSRRRQRHQFLPWLRPQALPIRARKRTQKAWVQELCHLKRVLQDRRKFLYRTGENHVLREPVGGR